jgi:hypothetical protein
MVGPRPRVLLTPRLIILVHLSCTVDDAWRQVLPYVRGYGNSCLVHLAPRMCVCCTVCLCICCTVGIDVFPLDAGLLDRGQYSEGPATGHLGTGFSWFPRVFKQILSWFPRLQVATTCLLCSPPDVNLVANQFHVLYLC